MVRLLYMFLGILLWMSLNVVSALGLVALALTAFLDAISIARLGVFSLNTFTVMYPRVKHILMVRMHSFFSDKDHRNVGMIGM
jgi:hypothetical protein